MQWRILVPCIVLGLGIALRVTAAFAQEGVSDTSYPAPGHVFEAKFSDRQFRLDFHLNGKEMTYTRPDGSGDTVHYTAIEIRPQVFMVYWTEPKSGSNVTHVEDFERGVVYTNIARRDGQFFNLKGTLQKVQ